MSNLAISLPGAVVVLMSLVHSAVPRPQNFGSFQAHNFAHPLQPFGQPQISGNSFGSATAIQSNGFHQLNLQAQTQALNQGNPVGSPSSNTNLAHSNGVLVTAPNGHHTSQLSTHTISNQHIFAHGR